MNIARLKELQTKLENMITTLQLSEEDTFVKKRIRTVINDVRYKISEEEAIERTKAKGLKTIEVDGESITVPLFYHGYNYDKSAEAKYKDGIIYLIPKEFKIPKSKWIDGFHEYAYAFIQREDKRWVVMCVKILGEDEYGDRTFASSYFYATSYSDLSYTSKEYGKNNCPRVYRDYYNQILAYVREVEGMEDFLK